MNSQYRQVLLNSVVIEGCLTWVFSLKPVSSQQYRHFLIAYIVQSGIEGDPAVNCVLRVNGRSVQHCLSLQINIKKKGFRLYWAHIQSTTRHVVRPQYQTPTNLYPPPTSASNCSLMESTPLTLNPPLLTLPSPLLLLSQPQSKGHKTHYSIITISVFLQIQQWEQNLEKFNMDLFRMRCYLASLQGGELPNPKSLLAIASRHTKTTLGRLGMFSVSSFHALVRKQQKETSPLDAF